jgi:hypothetical protein
MKKFYRLAEKRNELMLKNMLFKLPKNKVGVIVVAFHTQGIVEILRARGVKYKVITPMIKDPVNENKYIDAIKEQALKLD